jgi:hypothetical protein
VSIVVNDDDDFTFDDHIGTFKMPGISQSSFQVDLNENKFGDVVNSVVSYKKQPVPAVVQKNIRFEENIKMNGVSGVQINLDYAVDQASNGFPINVTPVFSYPAGDVEVPKADYLEGTSTFSINADNPRGTFRFFYPYYKMTGNDVVNFVFTFGQDNVFITKTAQKEPLVIPEFCDIRYSDPVITEDFRMGAKGIKITLNQEIPDAYYVNARESFTLSIDIGPESKKKEIMMNATHHSAQFNKSFTTFIPYCELAGYHFYSAKVPVNIRRVTTLKTTSGNEVNLGAKNEVLDIPVPELFRVSFNTIDIAFKRKQSQTLCFSLRHNGDTVFMNEGVIKGKNVNFSINTNLFIIHPDDEIMIYLADAYNRTPVVTLMEIKGYELVGMSGRQMKYKHKEFKKMTLSFVLERLK